MELLVVALLGALLISVLSAGLTAHFMRREVHLVQQSAMSPVDPQALRAWASMEQGMDSLEAFVARIEASATAQGRAIERIAETLERSRPPPPATPDLGDVLAAIDHATSLHHAGFERIGATLSAQRLACDRLDADMKHQGERTTQTLQSVATALAAMRDQLSHVERTHQVQWQALRHSFQAGRSEGEVSADAAAVLVPPARVAPPAPSAAAVPRAMPSLREMSDEELDALAPELPTSSPAPSTHVSIDLAQPEPELTDEELDALPPELPAPDKLRKRVASPPKKPTFKRL